MKFCEKFNNTLTFFPNHIRGCCVMENLGPIYFHANEIKNINCKDLLNKKKEFFKNIENGNPPCSNCYYLKEKNEEENFSEQFNLIYLNNWVHCNCGCFYCGRMIYSRGKITEKAKKSDYYDVLPIIKELYKNNLINRDELRVVFHGGDLSVLKEFKPLVELFMKNGVKKIDFSSNNIIYQPIIEKMLKSNKASLSMSLDCGCREIYKRIKRVDKFNDVIKNLKKYVKATKSKNPDILVKYILLKGINDNEEEIRKFINLMVEIGITKVSLNLEHKFAAQIYENKILLPDTYKKLIELFYELCKENNLYFDNPDEIMNYIMNKN